MSVVARCVPLDDFIRSHSRNMLRQCFLAEMRMEQTQQRLPWLVMTPDWALALVNASVTSMNFENEELRSKNIAQRRLSGKRTQYSFVKTQLVSNFCPPFPSYSAGLATSGSGNGTKEDEGRLSASLVEPVGSAPKPRGRRDVSDRAALAASAWRAWLPGTVCDGPCWRWPRERSPGWPAGRLPWLGGHARRAWRWRAAGRSRGCTFGASRLSTARGQAFEQRVGPPGFGRRACATESRCVPPQPEPGGRRRRGRGARPPEPERGRRNR